MNRTMRSSRREALGEKVDPRWAKLIGDDAIGIDGDIERLTGLYQVKYGYTHNGANAALVRRLSSLLGLDGALSEDACCS